MTANEHRTGWGVNLSGKRWHRVDDTKPPAGQVSFCGVGIHTFVARSGELHDILTGKRDAPICKKCAAS